MGVNLVIGLLGVLVLAHAAFATVQYRGILKVRDEEFFWPPFQVVMEICVSLVLCFWAALRVPGQFLPILPDLEGDRDSQFYASGQDPVLILAPSSALRSGVPALLA
ncbi:hypothetical protein L7F22_030937 [Adiantum nelumboides]|nr:hypothetical protein [Adiantum nelumboides]